MNTTKHEPIVTEHPPEIKPETSDQTRRLPETKSEIPVFVSADLFD